MSLAKAVACVERDAARKASDACARYRRRMNELKVDYERARRAIAGDEAEELKTIERWRVAAIAQINGAPVPLADIRSVKCGSVKRESVARSDAPKRLAAVRRTEAS